MKVIIEPATGAVMMAKTEDGKDVRVKSVSVQPFFATHNGLAGVVLGKSVDAGGSAVATFGLVVSGTNGKVGKGARPSAKGVTPLIDKKVADAKAASK